MINPVRLAITLIVAALIGWQVLRTGLADFALENERPAVALEHDPELAEAAGKTAEQSLADGDADGARILALRAITSTPLAADAVRELGFARQALGDPAGAARLLSLAAAFGWRDGPTQLWLSQAALAAGDVAASAQHLDAFALTHALDPLSYPAIDQLLVDPRLRLAMARRLIDAPAWRGPYFWSVGDGLAPPALYSRASLAGDIVRVGGGLDREDVRPLVDQLIANNDPADALRLWQTASHAIGGSAVVRDGGFEHVVDGATRGAAFEWTVQTIPDATAAIEAVPGGHRLAVTTDGAALDYVARQMVILAPGTHRLAYDSSIDPAAPNPGFAWQLQCYPRGHTVPTAPLASVGGRRVLAFTVPPACPVQMLMLLARRMASGTQGAGWFDNVAIDAP